MNKTFMANMAENTVAVSTGSPFSRDRKRGSGVTRSTIKVILLNLF